MASPQANDTAVAFIYRAYMIQDWILTASTALYCYEWLITLAEEKERIWAKKWTFFNWIFALNRYAILFSMVLSVWPARSHSVGSCVWKNQLSHAFLLLQFLASAAFTALRVYGISGMNRWISSLVFLCSAVPVFKNMVLYIQLVPVLVPVIPDRIECAGHDPLSDAAILRLSLSTHIALIVADVIALQVTWRRTIENVRAASLLGNTFNSSQALFRFGQHTLLPVSYILSTHIAQEISTKGFRALLILNIIQVLTNTIPSFLSLALASSFFVPFGSIIVCRFMLSLRQAGEQPGSSEDPVHLQSMRFSSNVLARDFGDTLMDADDDLNLANDGFENSAQGGRHDIEECPGIVSTSDAETGTLGIVENVPSTTANALRTTSCLTKLKCIARARDLIVERPETLAHAYPEVEIKLDYIEMNDPETFDVVPDDVSRAMWEAEGFEWGGVGGSNEDEVD
ncbi:hypothetical protein BC629DRAFT_1442265 [Irpex lacteus]|nr:hypothetical protein BC629DRAFT_1442265 [Irpex lacteus]